jgi:hypothetical protein
VDPVPSPDGVVVEEDVPVVEERHKVYMFSKSKEHPWNTVHVKELKMRSIFVSEKVKQVLTHRFPTIWAGSRKRLLDLVGDHDLTQHLKTYSMFVPRSQALMLSLKQRALAFLREYDLSDFTSREVYVMVARAVARATLIDEEEEHARALLSTGYESRVLRPTHTAFFSAGSPHGRRVGAFTISDKPPGAIKGWFYKRLRSLILF